jgi:hypothetical protein
MAILQFANNATATLAHDITGVDTTIYLAAGKGSLFPIPTTNNNFYATIYNTSSTLWEIVLVTARSGDVLTVVRAQEGTTAQTWLVGDSLGMYPTAATMNQLIQIDQLQEGTYTVVQAGGTANALTCQITSDLTSIPDGMTLVVKPTQANTGAVTLQVTIGSTILSSVPIVKGANLALTANDIPSSGYPVQLIYSVAYGAWVMQMPATLISAPVTNYTIDYLAVAGGGGGGNTIVTSFNSGSSGGGGAGGLISNLITVIPGSVFNIIVGAGGPSGTNGNNSSISSIVTVTGGGAGGSGVCDGVVGYAGAAGGSGGGGGCYATAYGGNGISGQGNAGGASSDQTSAGGGGGAGTVGSVLTGGTGLANSITGVSVYYAGGGGGGNLGSGGNGGGGTGGNGSSVAGGNGSINTGGGGGGGGNGNSAGGGGNGGSGIVIISMPTSKYSGITTGTPLVTTSGSNTILEYTNSGSYTA